MRSKKKSPYIAGLKPPSELEMAYMFHLRQAGLGNAQSNQRHQARADEILGSIPIGQQQAFINAVSAKQGYVYLGR